MEGGGARCQEEAELHKVARLDGDNSARAQVGCGRPTELVAAVQSAGG
jgi:hypothetical protein